MIRLFCIYWNYHVCRRPARIVCILVCILLNAVQSGAREIYTSEEELYEAYAEQILTDREYRTLLELYRYPVDLNGAELERLTAIPGIDDGQIEYILKYRETRGWIAAPESLAAIAGIDDDLLLPFVRVGRPLLPVTGTVRCRMEQTSGRDGELNVRADADLELRDRFALDVRTAGDDGGGRLARSLSLEYRGRRIVRSALAGNFRTSFGHKLVLGGPHDTGGGYYDGAAADAPGTGAYLTGSRATLQWNVWQLHLVQASRDLIRYVRNDDADSSRLRDLCVAGHLAFNGFKGIYLGASGLTALVRGARNSATEYCIAGCDWLYRLRHLSVLGEAAVTHNGDAGTIAGLTWEKRGFATRILYRDYATGFINPYSRAFASSDGDDDDADERGLLVRSDMSLFDAVKIWGSFNTWQTPSTGIWHRNDRIGYRQRYGGRHGFGCGVAFSAGDLRTPACGNVALWMLNELKPEKYPWLTVKMNYDTRRTAGGVTEGGYAWIKSGWNFRNGLALWVRVKADDNDLFRGGDTWYRLEACEKIRTLRLVWVDGSVSYTVYEDGRDAVLRGMVACRYRLE